MRKAIKTALGKRVLGKRTGSYSAATVAAIQLLPAELLAEESMGTKRAAFIKAAIESVAVYHSLNGYADSQGAFFSVMKREGYDVLKWLGEIAGEDAP